MNGYLSDSQIEEEIQRHLQGVEKHLQEIERLEEMKRLRQEDDDLICEKIDEEIDNIEGDIDKVEKKSWYKKSNCEEEDELVFLEPTDKEMEKIVDIWKENYDYGRQLKKHIEDVVGDDILVDQRLNYEHGAIVDHVRKSNMDRFVARVCVKNVGPHYVVVNTRWGSGYVSIATVKSSGINVSPGDVLWMVLKYSPIEKNSTHPFIGVYILNNWGDDGSGVTFEPENPDEFVEMDLKEAIEKHRGAVE